MMQTQMCHNWKKKSQQIPSMLWFTKRNDPAIIEAGSVQWLASALKNAVR